MKPPHDRPGEGPGALRRARGRLAGHRQRIDRVGVTGAASPAPRGLRRTDAGAGPRRRARVSADCTTGSGHVRTSWSRPILETVHPYRLPGHRRRRDRVRPRLRLLCRVPEPDMRPVPRLLQRPVRSHRTSPTVPTDGWRRWCLRTPRSPEHHHHRLGAVRRLPGAAPSVPPVRVSARVGGRYGSAARGDVNSLASEFLTPAISPTGGPVHYVGRPYAMQVLSDTMSAGKICLLDGRGNGVLCRRVFRWQAVELITRRDPFHRTTLPRSTER
jgi:hypothetical protein